MPSTFWTETNDCRVRSACVSRLRTALRVGAAALVLGAMVGSASAQFVPTEVKVSTGRDLIDPEFNQGKGQFTWVDLRGNIWVGGIDQATGAFVPANGKLALIERGAAPRGGLGFTLNGPEWVYGADGDRIVYTRFLPDLPETPENARIGVAWQKPNGKWAKRTLSPDLALNGPYGSETTDDPAPRISYNDALGNRYWREIDRPETEDVLPGLPQEQFPVARFVRGARAALYPLAVEGIDQVFHYDLDTRVLQQVTFGNGGKEQPWMWPAPELGGEMVMMATVGKANLVVYRKGINPTYPNAWAPWQTIAAPLGGRFFSTEPFVYDGKSYALMMVIVGDYPTSIWLAGFDPDAPLLRRLTPEAPDRARADPEIYITDSGPVVFFGRYNPNRGSYWLCSACAEGLYRAETGIPAAP
jgi:hypothetical protein